MDYSNITLAELTRLLKNRTLTQRHLAAIAVATQDETVFNHIQKLNSEVVLLRLCSYFFEGDFSEIKFNKFNSYVFQRIFDEVKSAEEALKVFELTKKLHFSTGRADGLCRLASLWKKYPEIIEETLLSLEQESTINIPYFVHKRLLEIENLPEEVYERLYILFKRGKPDNEYLEGNLLMEEYFPPSFLYILFKNHVGYVREHVREVSQHKNLNSEVIKFLPKDLRKEFKKVLKDKAEREFRNQPIDAEFFKSLK